jgi:hypothetical protein
MPLVSISVGELIDKITILEIKNKMIHDEELQLIAYQFMKKKEMVPLYEDLLSINKQLWDIEDSIRAKEQKQCFDDEFILYARRVYHLNDIRFNIKNKINQVTGSDIQEVKQYIHYNTGSQG